jgi:dipeptidyl aminopeptidase/acylaminoacyl peptidase
LARLASIFVVLSLLATLVAQHENRANWKLADRFTNEFVNRLVYSTSLSPGWISGSDSFWYRWSDAKGVKFYIVEPKQKVKRLLFDTDRMAAQLSEELKKTYDRTNLPITNITFTEGGRTFRFAVEGTDFEYEPATATLINRGKTPSPARPDPNEAFKNYSPDRKSYVFAREHNLFFVDVADEKNPLQLTKDGERYYSFGQQFGQFFQQEEQEQTQGQRRENRTRPNVTWSSDSKSFYIVRSDVRKVKELFLVNSLSDPRPTLMTYKYAMPGDDDVAQYELWSFSLEKKELSKRDVSRYKDQMLFDMHWTPDAKAIRFVRRDRLQRNLELCEMNAADGTIKVLITESVENAFLERQGVRYLKPGGDFIWYSERSGWGHYYLYSFDGKLKNQITSGPWRAESIRTIDEKRGEVWFSAVGVDEDENPYYTHTYRVKLDGSGMRIVDSGNANHNSSVSPTHSYLVDVSSRTDRQPSAVLRDRSGEIVMELEQTDLSALVATGWQMAETFVVKSADGVTNIYGNMWKPFDFDPNKKYPIIANVYPGPQTESVSAGFSAYSGNMRLAQLGFIVIQIGNRGGSPQRSNAYHSYGYFNLRDYGLADKKAGIEELAARFPWIDAERVGIYGHSGGGFMTAAALLLPPYNEFFDVGVSSAGNHDNNVYNSNWSEQHHGLKEVKDEQGNTKFDIQVPANHELAVNLKGHLLLVHGDMDNNVHPAGTIRLVNALIKAGKRFDMMMMPGKAHGFADMQGYFTQMMYEYFAEHLLGDYYRRSAEMKDRL